MKGWKTWAAAAALGIMAAIDIANGDIAAGLEKITAALALVGIGHKIDRAGL